MKTMINRCTMRVQCHEINMESQRSNFTSHWKEEENGGKGAFKARGYILETAQALLLWRTSYTWNKSHSIANSVLLNSSQTKIKKYQRHYNRWLLIHDRAQRSYCFGVTNLILSLSWLTALVNTWRKRKENCWRKPAAFDPCYSASANE